MPSLKSDLAEMDLSDPADRGITVTEISPMDEAIMADTEATAAFIGRALRGPLNAPTHVNSFAEFHRRFGGIWHRSSLGPAVQQFFEHGGRNLYIVRVANNARGAMICLPASGGVLVLRALDPGSTENIRAAVDYDGFDKDDKEPFNLTVQRVSPESGRILDQEIFRRVNCSEDSRSFVGDVLLTSSLIRAQTPLPLTRPTETMSEGADFGSIYVNHAQPGTDGGALSDYDLIGSARESTGLFALNQVDHFDLLYLPPPGRQLDIGPAAILAAERYSKERGAMLIMDPPACWDTVEHAIEGVKQSGYASPNIVSYFPRMMSKQEADGTARAVGAAIAGLLCKLDEQQGPWQELDQPGFGFNHKFQPALDLNVDDSRALVREGLNVIAGHLAGRATFCGSVTLGRGSPVERSFSSLTVRRLCLALTNAIERATRWSVFEPNVCQVAERIQSQVHAYMCGLAEDGAFADDIFSVQCDAGLHSHPVDPHRGVTVLLNFHPAGSSEAVSLTVHQTVTGYRVATTAFAPFAANCA